MSFAGIWPKSQTGALDVPEATQSAERSLPASLSGRVLARRGAPSLALPDAGEPFRRLYTHAQLLSARTVAVCSAVDGEGKTSVSLGLAITLAGDFPELRVAAVETSVDRPAFASTFGIDECPGLVDHLVGGYPLDSAYRPTSLPNLTIVPIGGAPDHIGRPFRSRRMAEAMTTLRQAHDVVILDVVSLLVESDSLALVGHADAAVLVVRAGITPVDAIAEAAHMIDPAKFRGVVLNEVTPAAPRWLRRLFGRP